MAERWAVSNGNWSNTATWNGGTLPTAADDVYANGFTVTIDQNITALSLRTTAGTTAVAGGRFTCSSGSFTITLTGVGVLAGTSRCIDYLAASPGVLTVNGNVRGGSATGANGILLTSSGTLVVNGIVTGGDAGSCNGIEHNGSGLVQITVASGDAVVGGTFSTGYGLRVSGTARFSITGNVASSSVARAIFVLGTATGNTITGNVTAGGAHACEVSGVGFGITVTGNVTGGSSSNTMSGFNLTSAGTLTVNGTVQGGTTPSAHGIHNASTATVTITGNAIGGTGTTAHGVNNASTGTVTITGFAIGSATTGGVGVANASTGIVTVGNLQFGAEGWPPCSGNIIFASLDAAHVSVRNSSFQDRTMISGGYERFPLANGNWSSVANWDYGLNLPQAADEVFADGKTVTIDQNVTVVSLNTLQRVNGIAGGSFSCVTNRTISANIIAGTTPCLNTGSGSPTIILNGNVYGGTVGTVAAIGVFVSSTGNAIYTINGNLFAGNTGNCHALRIDGNNNSVTINGNIIGGSGDTAPYGVNLTANSSLIVVGNVTGGTGTTGIGISAAGTGNVTVTGTITAGSGTQAHGFYVFGTKTVILNGDIYGGSGSNSVGVYALSSLPTITINGNIYGGSVSTAYGVAHLATSTITINGNATAGSFSTAYAIHNSSTGVININGSAIASTISEAINNPGNGNITASSFQHASNGRAPWTASGKIFFSLPTVNGIVRNSAGTGTTLGRVSG